MATPTPDFLLMQETLAEMDEVTTQALTAILRYCSAHLDDMEPDSVVAISQIIEDAFNKRVQLGKDVMPEAYK